MGLVGFDVFNFNSVFPSTKFNVEEKRFQVSGWGGTGSNLWWLTGEYEESEWSENKKNATNKRGGKGEEMYK